MSEFNGVFIEMVPSSEGTMEFRCGYSFPASADPDMVDYYKTLVAGIFGMVSTHPDDLVAIGDIVRTVSDFDVPVASEQEGEIVFEPAEELLEKLGKDKVIDLNKFKLDPKKKH